MLVENKEAGNCQDGKRCCGIFVLLKCCVMFVVCCEVGREGKGRERKEEERVGRERLRG